MRYERVKEELLIEILETIEKNYGIPKETFEGFTFLMAGKHKVFLMPKESVALAVERNLHGAFFKCYRVGLLLGEIDKRGFKFTIDGSHYFGKFATKNIYQITEEEEEEWLKGFDLDFLEERLKNPSGYRYVLIKGSKDFFGSGLLMGKIVKNLVPKIRRIKKISDL